MNNKLILALPEIQELVLHNLNAEERKEAALICRSFYENICRLEWNKTLKLDDKIMNDTIYESIMSSNRRFGKIEVDTSRGGNIVAKRIVAIIEKFKSHTKSLHASSFPFCSDKLFPAFLEATTEMTGLSLDIRGSGRQTGTQRSGRVYALEKEFSKLRQLSVCDGSDVTGLLEKVPDNALEELAIENRDVLNEENLQAFLNRQKSLKILLVRGYGNLNIQHLALEKLTFLEEPGFGRKSLAAILKNQTAICYLDCDQLESLAFEELRKMPNLEVLVCTIEESLAGELISLKTLEIYGNLSDVHQLALPKLEKLIVDGGSSKAEHFVTFSRSARNLQHVEFSGLELNLLSVIIESCLTLKTLSAHICSFDKEYDHRAPSPQNPSLEELIIYKQGLSVPMEPVFNTILACPNIQRVQLHVLSSTGRQLLELIQHLPRLTHFCFAAPFEKTDVIDPEFEEIINIFKASPDFIYLAILGIWDWSNGESIKNFLGDNTDRIIVELLKTPFLRKCGVKLTKSPTARDSFKNLWENY